MCVLSETEGGSEKHKKKTNGSNEERPNKMRLTGFSEVRLAFLDRRGSYVFSV